MRFFQSLDLLPPHFERLEAPSIWLRDFMPLQRGDGNLVGFHYGCRYMHDYGEELFDNSEIWNRYKLRVKKLPITADGGHFMEASRHWLVSDAVQLENPKWSEADLRTVLENALGKPILWLPQMPGDFTGHLDGIVRWYQKQELLVYAPLPGFTKWQDQFNALFRAAGYSLVEVATVLSKDPISAEGLSLNYVFDGTTFYGATPEAPVPQMPYRYIHAPEVLAEGGGIHCITYNFNEHPNQS
jgi:agmatine deiminase